jgi:hypothetical protein
MFKACKVKMTGGADEDEDEDEEADEAVKLLEDC